MVDVMDVVGNEPSSARFAKFRRSKVDVGRPEQTGRRIAQVGIGYDGKFEVRDFQPGLLRQKLREATVGARKPRHLFRFREHGSEGPADRPFRGLANDRVHCDNPCSC